MKIWHLSFETDLYDTLLPSKDFTVDEIQSFDGRKKKEHWTPLPVERCEPERGLALGDAPGFAVPVFSERALNVLRPLINDSVEELELEFQEGAYYAINVTTVLDVIDYEKSQYKMYSDGHRIMRFNQYVFRECDDLKKHHIFKIIDEPRRKPFVSDEFKRAVEENGLEGFRFILAWDSEEKHTEIPGENDKVIEDNSKTAESDACFSYVGNLDLATQLEITATLWSALKIFKIRDFKDGRKLAEQIYKIVNKILKTGKYPKEYEELTDVACGLGCLFGYALVYGYGWQWMEVGQSHDDATYCVVSPDEYWVNPSMQYLYRILTKQNLGVDGKNDNTVLLLYNMLEESMKNPPKQKLTLVW